MEGGFQHGLRRRLRHPWTKFQASVLQLRAQYRWFLTDTPAVNSSSVCSIISELRYLLVLTSSQDILGLLMILWPRVSEAIAANLEASNWLLRNANNSYRSSEGVDMCEQKDVRRLIAMDPAR